MSKTLTTTLLLTAVNAIRFTKNYCGPDFDMNESEATDFSFIGIIEEATERVADVIFESMIENCLSEAEIMDVVQDELEQVAKLDPDFES